MNKKGLELSINMIVVIILGIVILGVGISIFNQSFRQAAELREDVSAQTKLQLNSLLDDGSLIVVPFSNKETKRGNPVYFDVAIANELGVSDPLWFSMSVTFAGADLVAGSDETAFASYVISEPLDPENPMNWPLYIYNGQNFQIANNERAYVPISFDVPRRGLGVIDGLPRGQYIFNLDICRGETQAEATCDPNVDNPDNRHHTRQKLYINVV